MKYYVLSYKGTKLGQPMKESEVKAKLKIMSRCFHGLEVRQIELITDKEKA